MRSGCAFRNSRAPLSGFVSFASVVEGLHSSSPARFVIGIVLRLQGRERADGGNRPWIAGHLRAAAAARSVSSNSSPCVVCLQTQLHAVDGAGLVRLVDGELHRVADSDALRAAGPLIGTCTPIVRGPEGSPVDGRSASQPPAPAAATTMPRPRRARHAPVAKAVGDQSTAMRSLRRPPPRPRRARSGRRCPSADAGLAT